MHEPGNQGLELGVVPLLHHTLEEFLLFVPVTLASLDLEILVPKEAMQRMRLVC